MKNSYRGILRESEWNRPFILTAVAPSGRKPRAIVTESVSENRLEEKPPEVQFSYPVDYIPAGKKNSVRSWVRDRTSVLFTAVARSEAETAYRIRWYGAEEDTTEVVYFAHELWWSLPKKLTAQNFVAAIATGERAAVGLLDAGSVTSLKTVSSILDLNSRKIIKDGRDDCVARLNRGASRILVLDGKVFICDGAPLYVLWNGYRNQSITSVGTSRVVIELASSRPNPAFEDVSNELIFGRLFGADDHSEALQFAVEKNITLEVDAKIETLLPELLRQNTVEIQLEATLQKLLRLLSIKRDGTEAGTCEILGELQRLREVAETDDSAFGRGLALKRFLDWTDTGRLQWKKKFRVEQLFVRDAIDRIGAECSRRGEVSPFSRPVFDEGDEIALEHFR